MIYESLNIPWYAVFGNHDYGYGESGVRAQIDRNYVHDEDDLWKMESTNYTKRFCIDDVNICQYSLQIIFIDTTTLAPSENACCNSKG
jgi:DNA repair exonuclease SbcCD nuclease subunit